MKNNFNRLFLTVLFSVFLVQVTAQVKDLDYFRNKILNAYNAHQPSVTLDEGTFYLDYTSGGEFFEFNDMINFTINAYNTRFIFTSGERAFTFNKCKNVKFKGLTIDYWPLPFTQGTVSAKDGATITVDIHDGYAGKDEGMTNTFRNLAYFIEPDSKSLKADVFPTGKLSEIWINDRQVNITLTKNKNIINVTKNDRIVLFYYIQGDYFLVFETGNNYINIASKRGQYFEVGDTIVCANRQGVEVGMAILQSISEAIKPADFNSKRAEYLDGTSYENNGSTFNNYYRFNFNGALNAEESYYVYNINKVGAGCRIENTTYRNIRARGIIVKAPNSSIINNHIKSITGAGMMIVPEIVYWLESGPSRNLEISGNYVSNTNRRPEILSGTQSAGIVVTCEGEDRFRFTSMFVTSAAMKWKLTRCMSSTNSALPARHGLSR